MPYFSDHTVTPTHRPPHSPPFRLPPGHKDRSVDIRAVGVLAARVAEALVDVLRAGDVVLHCRNRDVIPAAALGDRAAADVREEKRLRSRDRRASRRVEREERKRRFTWSVELEAHRTLGQNLWFRKMLTCGAFVFGKQYERVNTAKQLFSERFRRNLEGKSLYLY